MHSIVLVVWSGLSIGAMGAFVAFGMALVLRVTGVMNLAQGEYFVLGGLVASSATAAGLPVVLALCLGAATGGLGCTVQEVALTRRTRGATASVQLLITVALATVLEGAEFLIWSSNSHTSVPVLGGFVSGPAGVPLSIQSLFLVGAVVVIGAVGYRVFERSELGDAIAALSQDPGGAQLIGIRIFRLRSGAVATAGVIAGLGGVLAIPLYAQNFSDGLPLALTGFIAVAVAKGRLIGVLVVSFALGIIEALISRYISALYVDAFTFVILATVVILLPGIGVGEAAG